MNQALALPLRRTPATALTAPFTFPALNPAAAMLATGAVPRSHAAPGITAVAAGSAYVRWLQRSLNRALGLRLRETGFLDAPSRSALRLFQQQHGLPVTGRAGPHTREALIEFTEFAPLEDGEIDYFLGGLKRSISRAAKTVGSAAKSVSRAATVVSRVVPLSQLAAAASRANPLSTVVRAAWGGVAAGLEGKNVLGGAVRAAIPTPLGRFYLDTGRSLLRGENLAKAMKNAAGAGIKDVREQLRFVQMVAPFVPGIGTGVGAALGAANALAEGKPITEAVIAAARGALPGGPAAQAGFDVAVNLAQGKNLSAAALDAARRALPGGALARAAFDTAVGIAEGKKIQEATINAARKALPGGPTVQMGFDAAVGIARGKKPGDVVLAAVREKLPDPASRAAFDATISVAQGKPIAEWTMAAGAALPGSAGQAGLDRIKAAVADTAAKVMKASAYAADPLSFAKAAGRGQNVQTAALSHAGKQVLAKLAR
jgi:peptidoglycan hydrolase-like protein with peptidoglycan-binding domain